METGQPTHEYGLQFPMYSACYHSPSIWSRTWLLDSSWWYTNQYPICIMLCNGIVLLTLYTLWPTISSISYKGFSSSSIITLSGCITCFPFLLLLDVFCAFGLFSDDELTRRFWVVDVEWWRLDVLDGDDGGCCWCCLDDDETEGSPTIKSTCPRSGVDQ